MTTSVWVIAAAGAGALAQSVTGIGLVLICGPLLVLSVGAGDGVRLALVLSLLVNAVLLAQHGKAVRFSDALSLLLPAAAVTVPAGILLRGANTHVAAAMAGAGLVLAAVLMSRGRNWPWLTTRSGTLLAGAASGAMNVLCAAAGPVAALYAANAQWPPRARTATLQAYFAALNIVSLTAVGLPSQAALLIPAALGVAIGLGAGRLLTGNVTAGLSRRLVLILAAAGGLAVLTEAIR